MRNEVKRLHADKTQTLAQLDQEGTVRLKPNAEGSASSEVKFSSMWPPTRIRVDEEVDAVVC